MKKLFFAFVAVSVVVLSACNNKPAESTEATADTTAVEAAVEATAPVVDSAAAAVAAAVDTAAAAAPAK